MRNKIILSLFVIPVSLILFSPLNNTRAQEVELGKDFQKKYSDYLNTLPLPGPFNGGDSNDMEKIIPSHQAPVSSFKFDLDLPSEQIYETGNPVTIKGKISYSYKGKELLEKFNEACSSKAGNENQCKSPGIYKIPVFENSGIFVQVWRKDSKKPEKGDYLVDEFYVMEDVVVLEGDTSDFQVNWKIPNEVEKGDYYLLFFINSNKRFDLSGTPLANSSYAERYDFKVLNKSEKKGIVLDKNNIKISGNSYAYKMPVPVIDEDAVSVKIPLKNLDSTEQNVAVKYELFSWGQTDSLNIISTKNETKSLSSNAEIELQYDLEPTDINSVYNLKVTAATSQSRSVSNVRFVIKDKNQGIFRLLTLAEDKNRNYFPLFCVRNAQWSGNFQGKVEITLNDVVWEKEGILDASEGRCFIIKDERFKIADYNCAKLEGKIFDKEGKQTNIVQVSYNCSQRGQFSQMSDQFIGQEDKNRALMTFSVTVALLAVISLTLIYLSIKKNDQK